MSEPSGGLRLFVAVQVPQAERFVPALEQLRAHGLRPTTADRLHVTLAFLAAVDEEFLASFRDDLVHIARQHEPVEMAVTGDVGTFGDTVVWAAVEASPDLHTLAGALKTAASSRGAQIPERPFHPHMTLARAGRRRAAADIVRQLHLPTVAWTASHLALIESQPQASGRRWCTVLTAPFGQGEVT